MNKVQFEVVMLWMDVKSYLNKQKGSQVNVEWGPHIFYTKLPFRGLLSEKDSWKVYSHWVVLVGWQDMQEETNQERQK